MKHAPGPWKFEEHDGNYEIWNNNTKIAIVNEAHEVELPSGTDIANANLLAAAPDMLEALEFILSQWPSDTDYAKRRVVAEAIDKAKGK